MRMKQAYEFMAEQIDELDTFDLQARVYIYVFSNPDSAIILAQLEIEFSKAVGEKNYKAIAYNNIGLSYDVKVNQRIQ